MTPKEAFGRRLLEARAFHHGRISQEVLAERAGIHRTQISVIEAGRREPMLETIVRLAGALDLSTGELFGPIRWVPGSPGYFDLGEEDR
jgi:transcriptional regulator with XRE-family HTH domain